SSDVCSSDLEAEQFRGRQGGVRARGGFAPRPPRLHRLRAGGGILRRRDRASAADHRRRAWVQAPGSRAVVVRQLHQGELRVSAAVVVGRRSRARAKVRAKARAGGPAPSPTTYTPYRTRRLQIRRTLATSLHLCAIVRLPPRAWRDVLSVQRLCASISRA